MLRRVLLLLGVVGALAACGGSSGDNTVDDGGGSAITDTDDELGDASGDDTQLPDDPPLPPTPRSFAMGFTPFWASSDVPFGDWLYDWLSDADLVALHADDFMGIPWDLFAASATPSLPPSWVDAWDAFADTGADSGKTLLLSVSPLSERSRLAPKVDADGNVTANWDSTVTGADAQTHCWDLTDAPSIATAYVRYIEWLVDRYTPDIVAIAIETDIQFYRCPSQKNGYYDLLRAVRDVVRAERPVTRFIFTFSLDYFYAQGFGQTLAACDGAIDDCVDARMNEALALADDGIGLSHYPQTWLPAGGPYPADRFARLRAKTNAPIYITETGWSVVPVRFSYAEADCSSYFIQPETASTEAQQAYLEALLGQAEEAELDGVVWWSARDYLDAATASTCPCSGATETCERLAAIAPAELFFRAFGTMGLWTQAGTPRSSLTQWRETLARPLEPR